MPHDVSALSRNRVIGLLVQALPLLVALWLAHLTWCFVEP